MDVVPKICEKCIIIRKKQFDGIIDIEVIKYLPESYKTYYFLYIIDQTIISF